jgi:hypothetical protein
MKGGPLEVAHSERIIVNDIEKGRDGERNEDKEEAGPGCFVSSRAIGT